MQKIKKNQYLKAKYAMLQSKKARDAWKLKSSSDTLYYEGLVMCAGYMRKALLKSSGSCGKKLMLFVVMNLQVAERHGY